MSNYNASINNVWPYYSQTNTSTAKERATASLGVDDFYKILAAQLSNQDPTQPMEDKEFIAQMAQFTSVEQLTNLASEIKLMRQSMGISSDLIGKMVSWADANASNEVVLKSGRVDSLYLKEGLQYAIVGSSMIPIDQIIEIWQQPDAVEQPGEGEGTDSGNE